MKKQPLFLRRNFVFAFGPADYSLAANLQGGGKRPLPGLAIGGACDPYELPGRHAFVARAAPQLGILTDGGALGCQPRVGRPPPRITADAWHELPLAIAGHGRPLPGQDGRQREAGVIGGHGRFARAVMLRLISFLGRKQGVYHGACTHHGAFSFLTLENRPWCAVCRGLIKEGLDRIKILEIVL